MKCYHCGSFLYESEYCSSCGADVSVYKKIVERSNLMYNKGLEHARARNLTRAVEYLEVSLRMYKGNINSRNLLGLVYVEMGEYAKGLSQWVLSKSIQSDNELADHFLSKVQKSQNDLDKMQASIKKYNKALNYVKQEDYDLAEVQLRRLLNDDKRFIKASHLLALIYIRQKEYDKARIVLDKAAKIDKGNPTTISYKSFVESEIKEAEKNLTASEVKSKRKATKALEEEKKPLSGDDVIIPKSSYKEAAPATLTIIQILIGIIIGAAIVFFVITPARVKTSSALSEKESAAYEEQVAELESELAELEAEGASEKLEQYEALLDAYGAYLDKDFDLSLEYLESVTIAYEVGGTFQDIYEMIQTDDSDEQAQAIADEMYSSYISNGHSYWQSAQALAEAYELSPYNEDVLYYLGVCYYHLAEYENSQTYLNEYLEKYPEGQYLDEVNELLEAMGS